MHEPEEHNLPDVSTEPQRRALDEMSRQLVERLNEMVQEQHERARRFAATQHSLSHLPGAAAEVPPPTPVAMAPQTETKPVHAPQHKKAPAIPPQPARPKAPQHFEAPSAQNDGRADWLKNHPAPAASQSSGKEREESGCGTVPTVVAIIIILIILRACS